MNNVSDKLAKKKSKVTFSGDKSYNTKKFKDEAKKIENFVSKQIKNYKEDITNPNNILYLKSEQLISYDLDKDLEKIQVNIKELRKIVREIVLEEINKITTK